MKALFRALGLVTITLSTALVLSAGCGITIEKKYDPPSGGPNRPRGIYVIGDGTGGSGGTGGTGGSGGTGAIDAGSVVPGPCECTASLGVDSMNLDSCATCFNVSGAFPADPCWAANDNCVNDDVCFAIKDCLSIC